MKSIVIPGLNLQKDEHAYFYAAAEIMEARNMSAGYEGGSSGVSLRICKGVSWLVGAQRGRLVRDRQLVPVACGSVIITDRRFIFYADSKSFSAALSELMACEITADCIAISVSDKTKLFRCAKAAKSAECLREFLPFQPSISGKRLFAKKSKSPGCLVILFFALVLFWIIGQCEKNKASNHPVSKAPPPQDQQIREQSIKRHPQQETVNPVELPQTQKKQKSPIAQPGQIITFELLTGRIMSGRVVGITASDVTIQSLTQDVTITIAKDKMTEPSVLSVFGGHSTYTNAPAANP